MTRRVSPCSCSDGVFFQTPFPGYVLQSPTIAPSVSARPSASPSLSASACYVSTVAGDGVEGWDIDPLGGPNGMLSLPDGALLLSESQWADNRFMHRVRIVYANGTVAAFAGAGPQGFSGDGGPATEAQLHTPMGMALVPLAAGGVPQGGAEAVLIADEENNRVRIVYANGSIDTWAGTGTAAVRDYGVHRLQADLYLPRTLTVHRPSGDVYIICYAGTFIARVDGSTGRTSSFISRPSSGVAAQIRFLDMDGQLTGIAALPPGTGWSGDFLVSVKGQSVGQSSVRIINSSAAISVVLARARDGIDSTGPLAVHAPSGQVMMSDPEYNRIKAISPSGAVGDFAGVGAKVVNGESVFGSSEDGVPPLEARIRFPGDLAFAPSGALLVAASWDRKVKLISRGCMPSPLPPPSPIPVPVRRNLRSADPRVVQTPVSRAWHLRRLVLDRLCVIHSLPAPFALLFLISSCSRPWVHLGLRHHSRPRLHNRPQAPARLRRRPLLRLPLPSSSQLFSRRPSLMHLI